MFTTACHQPTPCVILGSAVQASAINKAGHHYIAACERGTRTRAAPLLPGCRGEFQGIFSTTETLTFFFLDPFFFCRLRGGRPPFAYALGILLDSLQRSGDSLGWSSTGELVSILCHGHCHIVLVVATCELVTRWVLENIDYVVLNEYLPRIPVITLPRDARVAPAW